MSRFFLVELEPWADELRLRNDLWRTIKDITGVRYLEDMDNLSADTLTEILLPAERGYKMLEKPRRRR